MGVPRIIRGLFPGSGGGGGSGSSRAGHGVEACHAALHTRKHRFLPPSWSFSNFFFLILKGYSCRSVKCLPFFSKISRMKQGERKRWIDESFEAFEIEDGSKKGKGGRVEGMKTLILATRTRKSSRNPTVGDG